MDCFASRNDAAGTTIMTNSKTAIARRLRPRLAMQMCTVQKWHTSSRKISLRPGGSLSGTTPPVAGIRRRRSCKLDPSPARRPSASCGVGGRRGSDLSSVYVAPGGIYAPSANVYVRPGPAHRPYAEPGYGYRQPSTGWILHTAHRQRSMASTERPTPRSRSMSTARPPIPSVTTPGSATTPGIRLCAGICAEAAAARAVSRAGAMRRRLWQVGLLRLKRPAWRG